MKWRLWSVCTLLACSRPEAGAGLRAAPARAAEAAAPVVQDAGAAPDSGLAVLQTVVPQYAGDGAVATWRSAKSVGHTSTVYVLKGDDERTRMVFKPDTKHGRGRYRGEIAARQLAVALGIGERLPLVVAASFERAQLRGVLPGPKARADFDTDVVAQGDYVYGAGIAWVDGLQFPALHRGIERERWEGWLVGKEVPTPDWRALAISLSDMVVFDYLTGNFDRWSGGNIGQVGGPSSPVLYIDNDGAFLWPEPAKHLERQRALLLETRVFSKQMRASMHAAASDTGFATRVLRLPPEAEPFRAEVVDALHRRVQFAAQRIAHLCAVDGPRCQMD